jgi:hypothetical protein
MYSVSATPATAIASTFALGTVHLIESDTRPGGS